MPEGAVEPCGAGAPDADVRLTDPLPLYLRRGTEVRAVPLVARPAGADIAGVSAYSLARSAEHRRPVRGARVLPAVTRPREVAAWADARWLSLRERLEALQLCRPDALGSHATAAELLGIPLPSRLQRQGSHLHVQVPLARPLRREGIRAHRSARVPTTQQAFGVTLVSWWETLVGLASMLDEDELVEAMEGLLGPWRTPPVDATEIGERIEAAGRIRGIRALRAAMVRARPGVRSPQETRLRLSLVRAGLPEPAVNKAIWVPELGCEIAPDLVYERERVALEYEGEHHRLDPVQFTRDAERWNALQACGWTVEKVTARTDRVRLIARVRQKLRLPRPGPVE